MRYRPEHKEETHQRIVESASKEFRAHGFDGVGIAKLMGDLNLTHGGFYAHFADKEQLVTEACDIVLDHWLDSMLATIEAGSGFPGIIAFYLSEEHRDQVATGCLLPALTPEVARRPIASREAFTRKLAQTFDALPDTCRGGRGREAGKGAGDVRVFSRSGLSSTSGFRSTVEQIHT
jgi:TetR/AcrR family transcriptional repressor of nem operon